MLIRRSEGRRPQLIFTSDFHELVRGDLLPGPCVLRYDPHRVVPPQEIAAMPATQRPVTVSFIFHPAGGTWTGEMRFPPASRLVVEYDPTGQGTMLETEFPLPDGCEEVECWFSYVDDNGATHWDSAGGANHWLRFPAHDFDIRRAEIIAQPNEALDQLIIEVASVPAVETVALRWRYTQLTSLPRQQRALESTDTTDGRKLWTAPGGSIPVASGTPLVFDLVYTVGGHEFTDDNQGTWYVVSRT